MKRPSRASREGKMRPLLRNTKYDLKNDISLFFFGSTGALAAAQPAYVYKDDISCFFFVSTGALAAAYAA